MFYYLKGELALCEAGQAVIDCGGVGYKLTTSFITSQNMANKVGQNGEHAITRRPTITCPTSFSALVPKLPILCEKD